MTELSISEDFSQFKIGTKVIITDGYFKGMNGIITKIPSINDYKNADQKWRDACGVGLSPHITDCGPTEIDSFNVSISDDNKYKNVNITFLSKNDLQLKEN